MNDFVATVNGNRKNITFIDSNKVRIEDKEYTVTYSEIDNNSYIIKIDDEVFEIVADRKGNGKSIYLLEGNYFEVESKTFLQEKAEELLNKKRKDSSLVNIKAPMPGLVLNINIKKGDKIEKGELIIILEAMKMENDIKAPITGIVKDVFCKSDTTVEKGDILLIIE